MIWTSNNDYSDDKQIPSTLRPHWAALKSRGINPRFIPDTPTDLFTYSLHLVLERNMLRGLHVKLDDTNAVLQAFIKHRGHLPDVSPRFVRDLAKLRADLRSADRLAYWPRQVESRLTTKVAHPELAKMTVPVFQILPQEPAPGGHFSGTGPWAVPAPAPELELEPVTSDPEPKTTVNMFTNRDFAARIVLYFNPVGRVLDPCRGPGAFYEAMPAGSDWCEITEGRDFLAHAACCDWIITNPPWSRAYRDIAKRAFEIADNVVFLVRFDTALGTSARLNDAQDHGHAVKEVIDVSWRDAEFIVHGLRLVIVHWQRGWTGGITQSEWPAQPADLEDGPPEPPLAAVPEPPRPDPASGPELAERADGVRAGRQRPPPPLLGPPVETLLEHFKRLER